MFQEFVTTENLLLIITRLMILVVIPVADRLGVVRSIDTQSSQSDNLTSRTSSS